MRRAAASAARAPSGNLRWYSSIRRSAAFGSLRFNAALASSSSAISSANLRIGPVLDGGPSPIVLVQGLNEGFGITVDSTYVYFTDMGLPDMGLDGTVQRVLIGGGSADTLASSQDNPAGITVDATNLYWTNEGHVDSVNRTYSGAAVMTYPVAGGSASQLATGGETPVAIGLGNGLLYWVANGLAVNDPNPAGNGLWSVGLDGSGATHLAAPNGVAGPNLGISGGAVFWATVGTLDEVTLPSNALSFPWMSGNAGFPWDVVADATNVYWSVANDGTIMSMPLAGGPATTLVSLPANAGTDSGIAVDSTFVYYFACLYMTSACQLERVPIVGGPSTTLAGGFTGARAITVDASNVYFITWEGLYRVPK
jgi:hypothetical protein